ncbi:EKC/KEOPS complex subunit CGI121 [Plasmodium gonderi]|uniref:EKC/KEOPS complex subunit CGI121 n=1 Tax=Plasmodium gonderi TaxID=77519 RepID=A0A1Y1JGR6_PLAGO|nr:EKC/KEOPS complex subunit CGI121 [Plasmodium gonderi]GAW81440.1 EKC/KEOPS complex subunit CGI121 [Plasmodium gonderi]
MKRRELLISDETVSVTLALFKNVTNAKQLLSIYNEKTFEGSTNMRHFFLILDGQLVYDDNHIVHSIYRAYHNFLTERRITKNIILEVFFLLSPHEKINECLRQYQVREESSSIIYVGVNISDDKVKAFTELINGEMINLDSISSLHDKKQISENFKCGEHEINLERFIYHNIASKKINLG